MASKTENVKLGVCNARFKGRDLGLTKGGVEVSVTTETYKVEVDQFGKTPIKELVQGRTVTATVPMAESTIENMGALMPGSTIVTDGKRATATLTFTAQPVAAKKFTLGGTDFSFVAPGAAAGAGQIPLGIDLAATLENLVTVVNRSGVAAAVGGVQAERSGLNAVKIVAIEFGTAPNSVGLVAGDATMTASSATLLGGVTPTKMRLDVQTGAGLDLLDFSGELVLHPISRPESDTSEDFIIFRAAAPGELTFAYQVDAERVFNANFTGYPTNDGKLFALGDLTAK